MADFDINSILNSLSQDDIENLKKTAADILGGMGDGHKESENREHKGEENQEEKNGSQKGNFNPEDILKNMGNLGMPDLSQLASLAPILQAFNSHDERLDFINALKPLLSEERKKKADEAMKLVRLMSVLPLLKERGIM